MKYLEKKHDWDIYAKTNYGYKGKNAYDCALKRKHYHVTEYFNKVHKWNFTVNYKDINIQGTF